MHLTASMSLRTSSSGLRHPLLGVFYQALTQYLGFSRYGNEYTVMGLAPYGRPAFPDAMHDIVRLRADGSFELNARAFLMRDAKK
jgi:predicted NodU family carbamoyl transferase